MKKLFSMFFIATLFGFVFTACGNDDEPNVPEAQNLESVHENDQIDQYFVFDIDMNKDKSTIYMYNIQFGGAPFAMTLRVNVPATLKNGVYTLSGTDLVADMEMQSSGWVTMDDERYKLKNLMCTVNPKAKEYSISFDAHGGHFEESGKLK